MFAQGGNDDNAPKVSFLDADFGDDDDDDDEDDFEGGDDSDDDSDDDDDYADENDDGGDAAAEGGEKAEKKDKKKQKKLSSKREKRKLKEKKRSKKSKKAKVVDSESSSKDKTDGNKSDPSIDDDNNSEEDENEYQLDGFVVGSDDSDDAMDDSDDDEAVFEKVSDDEGESTKKSKKSKLSRLKKRSSDVIDDDELELLRENNEQGLDSSEIEFQRIQQQILRKAASRVDVEDDDDDQSADGDVIAPIRIGQADAVDDDDGSDLGGFLVYGDEDGGDDDNVTPKPRQRTAVKRRDDGPSDEQIREAEDIFGVGYADFLDEDFDEFEDGAGKGPVDESKIVASVGSKVDRHALIENFCTDNDEAIKKLDQPERMQEMLSKSYNVANASNDDDRHNESVWISKKLVEIIRRIDPSTNAQLSGLKFDQLESDLVESVENILRLYKVDMYEVPFIFAYRKDYFNKVITRKHLWTIVTLDEQWVKIQELKKHILKVYQTVNDAANSINDTQDTELEHQERLRDINTCIYNRNRLRREIKDAEDAYNTALDVVDNKDEDATAEDRENVEKTQNTLEILTNDLKEVEINLENAKIAVIELKRKKLMRASYRPEAAVETIRMFPYDHYFPLIESTNDEHMLKDIFNYLQMLLKGAENRNATNTNNDDLTQMELEQEGVNLATDDSSQVAYTSSRAILSGNNLYRKYRKHGVLRQLAEDFTIPACELGDAIRHGFRSVDSIPTPTETISNKIFSVIDNVTFKSEESVVNALVILLANEISFEPSVRTSVKEQYKAVATISTRPTPKGLSEISPFHELFGLHFLSKKPLKDLYHKDRVMFIQLIEAEKNGLITLTIDLPDNLGMFNHDEYGPQLMRRYTLRVGINKSVHSFSDPFQYDIAVEWDRLREKIVKIALENYLLPSVELEIRRELIRHARETIIEEASQNFQKLVEQKGYRPGNPRELLIDDMKFCPKKSRNMTIASIYVPPSENRSPIFMALIDYDTGVLKSHDLIPHLAMSQKYDKIKQFLYDYRPSIIVLNSSGGMQSRSLLKQIKDMLINEVTARINNVAVARREENEEKGDMNEYEYYEDEFYKYEADVLFINDKITEIFQRSSRAQKLCPEMQPGACAAVCLGRYVREPLAEYCSLWTCCNAVGVFGHEALHLRLHPLQDQVVRVGMKLDLLTALERVLINNVCDVGVDVNQCITYDHLAGMLIFIGGLGLRKAYNLRQTVRRTRPIVNRKEMLIRKLLSPVVYNNCAGFLRIASIESTIDGPILLESASTRYLDPFDATRIHPECYVTHDFAPKICSDAVEVEIVDNNYTEVVLRQMRSSHKDIEKKIKNFKEWIDLWEKGRPIPNVTKYTESFRKKDGTREPRDASCELPDSMSMLMLDDYANDLEKTGNGKRFLQLEDIKEEIRYPALDSRRSLKPCSDAEIFRVITNENEHTLYVGKRVGCTVLELVDSYDTRTNKRKQCAHVRMESGLMGRIDAYECTDDRIDIEQFNINEKLAEGQLIFAVVIGVLKSNFKVELSIRPSLVNQTEDWWIANRNNIDRIGSKASRWFYELGEETGRRVRDYFDKYFREEEALSEYKRTMTPAVSVSKTTTNSTNAKQRSVFVKRQVNHPLFMNIKSYKEAEMYIKAQSNYVGKALIRPSESSGVDKLTITWAFRENLFKHIEVTEKGKIPGAIGLGNELWIKGEAESFADLDEIYARYISRLNELSENLISHRYFKDGTISDVENHLLASLQQKIDNSQNNSNANNMAYCVSYDFIVPGQFLFYFMAIDKKMRTAKLVIKLKSSGYGIEARGQGNKTCDTPKDLINEIKSLLNYELTESAAKKKAAKEPPKSQPAPVSYTNQGFANNYAPGAHQGAYQGAYQGNHPGAYQGAYPSANNNPAGGYPAPNNYPSGGYPAPSNYPSGGYAASSGYGNNMGYGGGGHDNRYPSHHPPPPVFNPSYNNTSYHQPPPPPQPPRNMGQHQYNYSGQGHVPPIPKQAPIPPPPSYAPPNRGMGRGVNNQPAWMTQQQQQ